MKGHVVWRPIFVTVSEVVNCTDGHSNLANGIDNGQVDDSPVEEKEQSFSSNQVK